MNDILEDADLSTNEGILDFYENIIRYRNLHKSDSEKIARFAFDATVYIMDDDIKKIRYEFGALEAPGSTDLDMSQCEYEDELWSRLQKSIKKYEKEKGQF